MLEAGAGMSSNEAPALIKQSSLAAGSQRSSEEGIGNMDHGRKLPRKAGITQGFQGSQNKDRPLIFCTMDGRSLLSLLISLDKRGLNLYTEDGGLALLYSMLIIITSNAINNN